MKRIIVPLLLAAHAAGIFAGAEDSLRTIRAFEQVTGKLASSGFVTDHQFRYIRDAGFSHVISLLPGDQGHERSLVNSLGMSFTNIGVDWNRPGMKDLEDYFRDMELHKDEKVYLHCEANMRASAFLFLYRVIRLGTDRMEAREAMFDIWYPVNQWHRFIEKGLEKYGMDPEYRYEPEFIRLFREYGPMAAEAELERIREELGGNGPGSRADTGELPELPFRETDLERVGDEYAADNETERAIEAYRLNAEIFPDSWKAQEKLGDALMKEGNTDGAGGAYERVLALNPEYLWAKRMLGKLGTEEYAVYWEGTGIDPGIAGELAGEYDLGPAKLEFIFREGKFFVRPSWSRKPMQLFADSALKYFVRGNNWNFEFSGSEPREIRFITSGNTYSGRRVE